jgi:PAS domain S-box-containing protein
MAKKKLFTTSDEGFKNVFYSIGEAVITTNREGFVNLVNPIAEWLTGWTEAEAKGKALNDIFHVIDNDINAAVENQVQRILQEGLRVKLTNHFLLIARNGSKHPIAGSGAPIRSENNTISGVVLVFHDQTKERAVENALRESEERFRLAFEYAGIGMGLLSIEGRWLRANQSICEMLGYSEDELRQKTFQELTHPDDLPLNLIEAQQLVAGEIPYMHVEKRYRHRNGHYVWARLTTSIVRSAEGRPQYYVSQIENITEHKLAEEKLIESEERYKRITTGLTDYLYTVKIKNGKAIETIHNDACIVITGYTPKEFAADPYLWINMVVHEERELVAYHFSKIIAEKDVPPIEHRIICKDGKIRWISDTAIPKYDSNGELISYDGVIKNITERKRAEDIIQVRLRLLEFSNTHSTDELLTATLDEIEALTGSTIGFYHFLESDQKTLLLQNWSTNTLRNMCTASGKGSHYDIKQAGVWVDCVNQRCPIIHNDYASLPHRKGMPEGHAPVIREVVVPIFRGNMIKAIIGVGNKSTEYNESDIEIVSKLGDLSWDIVEHKHIEEALRDSEAKFSAAFFFSPSALSITSVKGLVYLDVNESFLRLTGYKRMEVIGHTSTELKFWENSEQEHKFRQFLFEQGSIQNFEFKYQCKNGKVGYGLTSACIITLNGENCILAQTNDITEHKRAEMEIARVNRALRMLSDTNQALIHITDENTLLNEVCRIVVEVGGYRLAWVGFVEHDEAKTVRPVAHAGFESGYIESAKVSWADNERGRGPGGTAIRTGQQSISRNIPLDPTFAPWREAAIQCGYKSIIALPLTSEDQTFGALGIYSNETDAFDTKEVEILKELADDLAFGITALRMRAKRDQAEGELHQSQRKLALHLEQTLFAVIEWDTEFKVRYWNPAAERIFGYAKNEALGQRGQDLIIPEDLHANIEGVWKQLLYQSGGNYNISENVTRDKKIIVCEWINTPLLDEQGIVTGVMSQANDITERKKVEKALQISEEKYLKAFRSSPIALTLAGVEDEVLVEANHAFEQITGYSLAEALGKTARELNLYPDPREREHFIEMLKNKRLVRNAEMHLRHKSGESRTVQCSSEPITIGKLEYVLSTTEDITEHKRAEEALKRSEERLRLEVVRMPIGYIVWDKDFRVVTWNPAAEKIFGFTFDEVKGRHPYETIVPSEAQPQVDDIWRRLLAGDASAHSVNENLTKDGRTIICEWSNTPLKQPDGTVLGVMSMVQDITKRVQAEEALRESEERFRRLAENARDVIYRMSLPDGKYEYVSPAALSVFGYSPAECHDTPILIKQAIHPDWHKYFEEQWANLIKGEMPPTYEYQFIHKSGEVRWLNQRNILVRDDAGNPIAIEGIVTDITERKQAEEAIRKLNQELEQRVTDRTTQLEAANKELEAFAYSVSHDLRTPLRHIDGFLELLQNRIATTLDEESRHYMTTISNSSKRMGMLIDDLLSFSRMGRIEMSKMQVNLNSLIRDVIRELEPDTKGRNINWHIADLPVVTGDQDMLRIVLVNLISNALKFTRSRPRTEIEIGGMPNREIESILFVRDNGVGFDMKYADKLFGVFQRLHRADEFEGIGIGLANVKCIINRHGGKTWAEGQVNQGATFYFSLPKFNQGV